MSSTAVRRYARIFGICALVGISARADARSVTVSWSRNVEPEVTGYTVLYGAASRVYTTALDAGNVSSYRVDGLPDEQTVYFAVQAYTKTGLRSQPSTEVILPGGGARVYLDTPANGSALQQPFVMSGWAADAGSTTGTGIDAVHLYAYPDGGRGTPVFLGTATTGMKRADVAAFLGSSRFEPTGFGSTIAGLLPGSYLFVAFGHSAVTGKWNASAKLASVQAGPVLSIESPAAGSLAGQPFYVTGWALDSRARTGTGVDSVMVYAQPASGGARTFLGEAVPAYRPDLAARLGTRFGMAGYYLGVHNMPAGQYRIIVDARSTVTGGVEASESRLVQTGPLTIVDSPDSSAPLARRFTVSGWSIDSRSTRTAGIDAMHVYAYPLPAGDPIFLGAAQMGVARPDVAAIHGSQYEQSGFQLTTNPALAPGWYLLVLFPRSSVSNAFATPSQLVVRIGP